MVNKVLMVCLGNICRSPIAEAVMVDAINQRGIANEWQVDSAAIGDWHIGNLPDERALRILNKHNLTYTQRARQIKESDFTEFDYIFGMDDENIETLTSLAPKTARNKIHLLGDYGLTKEDRIIKDPYYHKGEAGFEKAFQQCQVACNAFLDKFYNKEI